MNYLDLFHGIGGFALGAYWAGMKFEHHYCSDIEPWCQKLYAKRFPDSIQLGDITKIDATKLPTGDWIITGGFPCQDISIAGKGAGIHGERSGLWFEYWRIINDLRPRFAIMENVGMLVHRGLREVLGSLAEIGYNAEWQDIRASDVGAPHRRERIWIVAYAEHNGRHRSENIRKDSRIQSEGEAGSKLFGNEFAGTGCLRSEESGRDSSVSAIPHPSLQLSHGVGEARRRRREFTDSGDEFSDAESEQAGGIFKQWIPADFSANSDWRGQAPTWATEPDVGRLAHGVPHRVDRLRGLGNAIVPQIAELLFRRIFAKTS